jgi:UDP-N-acetylglucosamine 2-epimerase (non-hydrolysing)
MPDRRRKILSVVGTRPNFVKIAPILRALDEREDPSGDSLASVLVHTGQHYDGNLSTDLLADLHIRAPDHSLGVGSGSHASMTADVMRALEPILLAENPDVVLVVGDVNSTVAGALTAAKLGIRVAHVEAGLRSFDRRMPEEVNRVVTDALSEFLFTSEDAANANLMREGHPADRVHFVGNVMIDSLLASLPRAAGSTVRDRLGLDGTDYAILTVHRPSNVENWEALAAILGAAADLSREIPIVFPAHPRTRARIAAFGLSAFTAARPKREPRIRMTEPLAYLDFIHLLAGARLVLTDSGGLQEETAILGVPCLTLRDSTERPVTIDSGTSLLVGADPKRIVEEGERALQAGAPRARCAPPLWDGRAAERIVAVLAERL